MVVKELALPEFSIALFPLIKTGIMLFFFFIIIPKLNHLHFKRPFLLGFLMILISNIILVISPVQSYIFVIISTIFDAAALALILPFKETLMVDAVDPKKRASIMALFNLFVIILASPFGWISGILSEHSRLPPFFLLIGFSIMGLLTVLNILRHKQKFDS